MSVGAGPLSVLWLSYLPSLKLGGQRNLQRLVLGLDPARIRSAVVSPAEGELSFAMRAAGVSVHICPLNDFVLRRSYGRLTLQVARQTLREARALRAIIKEEQVKVVYADSPGHARYAWLATQGLDVRVLWHAQVSSPDSIWDATLAGCVDRVVAVSRGAASRFDQLPELPPERLEVLYNGVDLGRFRGIAAPDARERLYPGAPADATIAVFVGSLVQVKGTDELVVAAGKLAKTHPNLHFSIAGEGAPVYREALETYAKRSGARVHFAGFLENIEQILPAAELLVFPSYCEGLPLSVLEAMASGLPVIATDVPGSQELVDSSVGRLVPVRNIEALCGALAELAEAPELRRELGQRARERAARYTLGRCIEGFEATFLALAQQPPRSRLSRARWSGAAHSTWAGVLP
jgi:glycosyltransferase involved in cell wall biosynthesis